MRGERGPTDEQAQIDARPIAGTRLTRHGLPRRSTARVRIGAPLSAVQAAIAETLDSGSGIVPLTRTAGFETIGENSPEDSEIDPVVIAEKRVSSQ